MNTRLLNPFALSLVCILLILSPVQAHGNSLLPWQAPHTPELTPLAAGDGLFAQYYALGGTTVLLTVDGEGPINHGHNGTCTSTSNTMYQNTCGLWAGTWNSWNTLEEVFTGYIEAPTTGHYEFHAWIDDYLAISINGVSDLVDIIAGDGYSIELDMIQGHFYPINMHYKNRVGSNNLALAWTKPDSTFEIVPKAFLYTEMPVRSAGDGLYAQYYALDGSESLQTIDGEGPINHGWTEGCFEFGYTKYQGVCGYWAGTRDSEAQFEEILTGYIEAPYTGHYEFHASIDDYLAITINGESDLVDDIGVGGYSIELDLVQGYFYPITMHFKNRMGSNNLALWWEELDIPFSVVPKMYLYTTNPYYPTRFGKTVPINGIDDVPTTLDLTWASSSDSTGYEYCYYSTDASDCAGTWSVTDQTFLTLSGLDWDTTYHWQVRAVNDSGSTDADMGTWWAFTTEPFKLYIPMMVKP